MDFAATDDAPDSRRRLFCGEVAMAMRTGGGRSKEDGGGKQNENKSKQKSLGHVTRQRLLRTLTGNPNPSPNPNPNSEVPACLSFPPLG